MEPDTIAALVDRAECIALRTEPELAALDPLIRRRRLVRAILRQLRLLEQPAPLDRPSSTTRLPRQG